MSEKTNSRWYRFLSSSFLVYILAVSIALGLGAILIWIIGGNVGDAYAAMFKGSIFNYEAKSTAKMFAPLTKTIFFATPLIIAGLALGIGFRAGLFNIGGTGQVLMGAVAAAWVGIFLDLPFILHLLVALVAAIVAGAIWGWIPGILKAKTGANEVIVTIMMNTISTLFLAFILTKDYWHRPGSSDPRSPVIDENAQAVALLPKPFQLDSGVIVAIVAALFMWWFLDRSTWGYQLRAVGANPNAAKTAGMSIGAITAMTMAVSGALCGLAGGVQMTSTMKYLVSGVQATIGIDAITVALLGRNKPLGTIFAGLIFGAFKAGGSVMQIQAKVPVDMVLILQSVIVLLVAAPPFVRWLFRLPSPDGNARKYVTLQVEKPAEDGKPAESGKVDEAGNTLLPVVVRHSMPSTAASLQSGERALRPSVPSCARSETTKRSRAEVRDDENEPALPEEQPSGKEGS
ncbi:MAG: ABC transporter permease [Actinomycetaceae bacterium]|nr:ABC transporter permease [Actinomycetaceae bacterium]